MKKVDLFLFSLVAFVTLSVGFSSCGGGGSKGITINNDYPFAGTWVPKDGNSIYQSIVIKDDVSHENAIITYKDGDIERTHWKTVSENTDKSKCEIIFYTLSGIMKFDDTSLLNASMDDGEYKFKRSN